MRELFTLWRHTKMVVLVALTAAIYAATLIPFKVMTIIPGITEVRPGVVVPVVFGLLFGPAGAWGSGIGNVIGDVLGGTLTLASPFGFLGNFLFALTAYKVWGRMGPLSSHRAARLDSAATVLEFVLAAILASAVCAATVAWGLELLGMLPFTVLGGIIFANNALVTAILGPVLFRLLQPRAAAWHLLWMDILEPEDISKGPSPRLGALLLWIGGLGGLAAGVALSMNLGGGQLFQFGAGTVTLGVKLGLVPFAAVYLLGCWLA
ncbi:MAG: QueT transporter family protein [Deltaproteobacteria bacterium]|nr:QueT transporter family protein [Deltaproteobacteria bacterium]